MGSCFDRSEENVGLVNGDYEKRTSIRVFSGRAAFVSEQNESFSLGGGSNGWDIRAIIKRRGKYAQDSLVLKDCTLSHKVNTSVHASGQKGIKILSGENPHHIQVSIFKMYYIFNENVWWVKETYINKGGLFL